MKRLFVACLMLAVGAGVGLPSVAAANSGSITGVQALGNDADGNPQVAATFSATWTTCTTDESGQQDCSWFPEAGVIAAGLPCPQGRGYLGSVNWVWSGDLFKGAGTQTETTEFEVPGKGKEPIRLCLYAYQQVPADAGDLFHLLAETVYRFPIPALTLAKARTLVRLALARRFRGSYVNGRGKRVLGCQQLAELQVRCGRISWASGAASYQGAVTVSYTGYTDGGIAWHATGEITRTNRHCVATGGRRCTSQHHVGVGGID